jgi:hypothetical protein
VRLGAEKGLNCLLLMREGRVWEGEERRVEREGEREREC